MNEPKCNCTGPRYLTAFGRRSFIQVGVLGGLGLTMGDLFRLRASDIRPANMAEMTRRVNERMGGPRATMRDRAAITHFFDGLQLLEPGVVQPQQWQPEPGVRSPSQVTAWCGVAQKR